jgi:hypothetical protein
VASLTVDLTGSHQQVAAEGQAILSPKTMVGTRLKTPK